jgi:hypothetical protein
VLASAAVITGMAALMWGAVGLGILGLLLTGMGLFAPEMPHDITHWFQHLFQASSGAQGGATH